MAETLLYDGYGNALTFTSAPPERQAEIGRVKDPWVGRTTGTVTPEMLARVLKGDAELADKMAVAKKLLEDDHIFSCVRNLANAVGKLDWELEPFDESAGAKKDAKEMTALLQSFRKFSKLRKHLVLGEFYPFVAPELQWNRDYLIDGFTVVDPVRWTWDRTTNSLRLRTLMEPTKGVPINPRGFCFHTSSLEPGNIREAGLWRKVAWLWLFKHSSWEWLMRFANAYGNPYIWGFFNRPEDKESVLEAVSAMAANARAVFPAGTDVQFQEAQRYGTVNLYEAIRLAAEGGITKVINGHVLNSEAKSGTGTLAGNHAENVSQDNIEGVAAGLGESLQETLVAVLWGFHRGWDTVETGEMAKLKIKADPPKDQEKLAKVFVTVNEGLAPSGKIIDPSQFEDEFQVRTIDRPKAEDPAAGDTTGGTTGGTTDDEDEAPAGKPAKKKEVKARVAASKKKRLIQTTDELAGVATALGTKANEEQTARIQQILDESETIEEFRDRLWEEADSIDHELHGEVLAQAMGLGQAIGQGDAAEESDA